MNCLAENNRLYGSALKQSGSIQSTPAVIAGYAKCVWAGAFHRIVLIVTTGTHGRSMDLVTLRLDISYLFLDRPAFVAFRPRVVVFYHPIMRERKRPASGFDLTGK